MDPNQNQNTNPTPNEGGELNVSHNPPSAEPQKRLVIQPLEQPAAVPQPPTPQVLDQQPSPAAPPPTPLTPPVPLTPPTTTPTPVLPSNTPPPQVTQPATPAVVSGDGGMNLPPTGDPLVSQPNPYGNGPVKANRFKWPLIAGAVAAVLLVGSASAYYVGVYNNPDHIYSQSLKDTGKGYDKLVDHLEKQNADTYQTYSGKGDFKYTSDSFKTDGSINFKGDKKNAELTFDVGLAASRPSFDIRAIDSASNNPDIYFKASNLKGLGSLLGDEQADTALSSLDNKWIAIDHTLLDNLTNQYTADATQKMQPPTKEQIVDEARAFGTVNNEYLYNTDQSKAVTKVVNKVGRETIDGHKTYHYKIAINKDNFKKYATAQQDALLKSKLGDWVKKNKYETDVRDSVKSLVSSADEIKSSDTYDIWMDTSHRVVYKVRIPESGENAAKNYADVGLDYKGGDTLPFFISGESDTDGDKSSGILRAEINTKTDEIAFKANIKESGSSAASFTMNLNYLPAKGSVKIEKPATSEPLSEATKALGLGDLTQGFSSSSSASSDTTDDSSYFN